MMEWFTPKQETWLFKVNPALKIIVFFSVLLLIFFKRDLYFMLILTACYGCLLLLFSGYPLRKVLLLLIPFVLSSFSSALGILLFGKGNEVIWQWTLIKISNESVASAQIIASKTLLIGILSLIFLLTTKPVLLFYSLMQQLKFPPKYMYSFMAAIRLIPIIIDEFQIRSQAIKIRRVVFAKGFKGIFDRLKLYIIPLMAQSIRRAQRIAVAMEAKEFHIDRKRTYYYQTPFSLNDVLLCVLIGLTPVILIWFRM